MTTHALQFGKRAKHPSNPLRTRAFGNHFLPTRPTHSDDKQHQKLVSQTEKWVAQTFYGQLLKQMHNSPFKSKLFSGGRGGEAFGEMFDQKLADRMSKGAGKNLVNAIVNKMEAAGAYKNASKLPKTSPVAPQPVRTFRGVA